LCFLAFLTKWLFTKTGEIAFFAAGKNARNGDFLFFFEKKLPDFA
jgi:hypothetical protein